MDIETLGTSTVERAIARTGRLVSYINKKDKEPIWDGYVAVYSKSGNTHNNADLLDAVWVQVKGELGDTETETLSYPVRTEDLRQFAKRKHNVFFVVRIGEKEQETVYYCPFTEKSIAGILKEKGAKKTASLSFRRFPDTVEEKEALFLDLIGGKAEEGESLADDSFLYDAGVVEFWGRSEELEALEDFLSCPEVFRWWGIAAPDGAGKSRLALEFAQELEEDGTWTARFLSEEDYEDLDALLKQYSGPLLLIADDALYHVDTLGKWMTSLSSGWTRGEPLRLLLIDRDQGWQYDSYDWERQLYKVGHELLLRGSRFDTLLRLESLGEEALTELMHEFAFALRRREPSLPALRRGEEGRLLEALSALDSECRPLYAMILTDAFLHDRNAMHWTREPLFDWLVKRERGRLREAIRGLSVGNGSADEELFSLCLRMRRVACVLGRNGALDSANLSVYCAGELEEIAAQAEARGSGSAAELLLALGLLRVSECRFFLTGFYPEPLAEYELLNWLRTCNTPKRAQKRARFFWAVLCDEKVVRRFFSRLFADYAPLLQADTSLWEKLLPADLNLDDRRAYAYSGLLYEGFIRCTDRGRRLYMLRCLERLARDLLQTDTEEAGSVYNDLGLVYHDMGDFPRALEYCHKALAIREKVYGEEHPDTATSYNNLGTLYHDMGDFPRALKYHKKALAILEKLYSEEHPSTAMSHHNIAMLYYETGDYHTALEHEAKATPVFEALLGPEHPHTQNSRQFQSLLSSLVAIMEANGGSLPPEKENLLHPSKAPNQP